MCKSFISVRISKPLQSTSASQSVSSTKWIPLMKPKGIETTLRDIFLTKVNENCEKQERQQSEKKKECFKNKDHYRGTLVRKSVMYYLFTFELFLEIPILLWQAGSFFSLKTMDRWQTVNMYNVM